MGYETSKACIYLNLKLFSKFFTKMYVRRDTFPSKPRSLGSVQFLESWNVNVLKYKYLEDQDLNPEKS